MTELTSNQKLVLETLRNSSQQMSAYEILDQLRPAGLKAPLQVYRALEKLIDLQLVHKLESLNAFVSCDHTDCHGGDLTAFTICNDCGDVRELGDVDAAKLLKQQVGETGFQISKAAIEITGVCENCA